MDKLLILDDEEIRHETFRKILVGRNIFSVYDYDQLVALYSQYDRFDVVYLDHDLSLKQAAGMPNNEKNGTDAAEFIASLPPECRPARAILHSWNDYGAKRQQHILIEAGINAIISRFKAVK